MQEQTNIQTKNGLYLYFGIAFLIPLILVGLFVWKPEFYHVLHGSEFDILPLIHELAAQKGMDFRWELYNTIQLCIEAPVLWFILVYTGAPTIAALLVTWIYFQKSELVLLLKRLLPWGSNVRLATGLKVWALAIAIMTGTNFMTLQLRDLLGFEDLLYQFSLTKILTISFLLSFLNTMFLDQGGLLEELGWTGFALPRLEEVLPSALHTAFLLGTIWAIWHIPRDIVFGYNGDFRLYLLLVLIFIIGCISYTIVIAFFFHLTGGSVLISMAFHGMMNDNMGLAGIRGIVDVTQTEFLLIFATKALPYVFIALFIIWKYGKSLRTNQT